MQRRKRRLRVESARGAGYGVRFLRFGVGLLLLPVAWGVTRALGMMALSLHDSNPGFPLPIAAFVGGLTVWMIIFFTLPRPMRTYVLAHELTHALWGAVLGEKVFDLKVAKDKGSVTLSDSNFLITLAPYFFPLYAVLALLSYYLLALFYNLQPYYPLWLALVGFTWGFHLTFTFSSLFQHQSDIRECGHLFSYGVIYLFNLLGIALALVCLSSATLEQMFTLIGHETSRVWILLWHEGIGAVRRWMQ